MVGGFYNQKKNFLRRLQCPVFPTLFVKVTVPPSQGGGGITKRGGLWCTAIPILHYWGGGAGGQGSSAADLKDIPGLMGGPGPDSAALWPGPCSPKARRSSSGTPSATPSKRL